MGGGAELNTAYLKEDELGKLKTIFWAFNIVDFTPFLDTQVVVPQGDSMKITGTWFNRLAYDASLPEAERKTWTIAGPAAGSPLRESGLIGPVKILF